MARQVANVDIITDTFEIWLLQTNELLNSLSTEIITANSNVGVTGNTTNQRKARLVGSFAANSIVVTNELRGGNISSTGGTYANLQISTNTIISNATSSYVLLQVANSSQSANLTQANLVIGLSTVNSTAVSVGSNSFINSTMYYSGNSTSFTAVRETNTYSTGSLNIVGNVNFSNTLTVVGNTQLSNTLNVTGTASFQSEVNLFGGVSNPLFVNGNYYIIVTVNNDIGSTVSSPVKVYEFPTNLYSTAKFEVQVKKGSNTQISELVLAHDTSSAYVSVYGTVASPPSSNGSISPLGTFSANINSGNVHLLLTPTIANSAVKVIAHLIK